jgi:muramidase (phage lysozyme)
MSDTDRIIDDLARALKPFAEWEFPPGVEQTFGVEWVARWRKRAQAALLQAGKLDAALRP